MAPARPTPFKATLSSVGMLRAADKNIQLGSVIAFLHVCESEGMSIKVLAHLYGYSESSMSRYVHALAEPSKRGSAIKHDGLVAIARHPDDSRRRLVFLTTDGRRLREAILSSKSS